MRNQSKEDRERFAKKRCATYSAGLALGALISAMEQSGRSLDQIAEDCFIPLARLQTIMSLTEDVTLAEICQVAIGLDMLPTIRFEELD